MNTHWYAASVLIQLRLTACVHSQWMHPAMTYVSIDLIDLRLWESTMKNVMP